MKRLILMRHAKTEPFGEGIDDFGRALTEQGHSDAARIAEELVALGWSPERILVSTARRAHCRCWASGHRRRQMVRAWMADCS